MPNIRFLKLFGCTLSGDFGDLFSELRWLTWYRCPKGMQANNFCPKNLLILDLTCSSIDEHWDGWTQLKVATRLRVLQMSACLKLSMVPDLSAFLFLETLILKECRKLVTLPNSIGMLNYLVELDVSDTCISELPDTIVDLRSLKVLKMNRSRMQKLPEAIVNLDKLEEIYGEGCVQLEMIPGDIVRLQFLKILKLTGTHVKYVPNLPQSLVSPCLSSTVLEKDPDISNLVSLRNLELCFPLTFRDLPSMVPDPPSLEGARVISSPYCKLELSIITSISSYLGCFHCLKELELKNCSNLRCIGQLPSTLGRLTVGSCDLLEVVDLSNLSKFKNLKDLEVWRCWNLVEIKGVDELESLESIYIKYCISLLRFPSQSNWKKMKKWHVDVLGRIWQE
ncbi:protein SUPPRESSOR OF npr1-1, CONSTITUTIVE 1-like [Eucalyptus grandis]|uniref:protein SUPPRESSOR OF npr1-1, CONSTITUTIVE 1-like n=1 Tax=Eucalyptus grandis TaxID=71139 RepID=UPI00192E9DAD|nr:protein SUPPRESSOR OF npr1-1, CONSTITUTIVE 1-like [Eucalyptus grandis]